ncbi:TM2 domain-containing membrane protein YozV [Sedimentibacter acidaminivorans]|uniref:TM2 domain-containing membrane protein YozV n=1 Tax=Sedimentibacter acidaminivorans TaxID=913099 RepID=A0ABS4GBL3_9FIRM|nr:hypothetical protein [Sedimentibacter acidaminivorans]MBP1925078.1 TM2 domain-containing membrane protein YozV [Sedimentibacter acidaminivorans]
MRDKSKFIAFVLSVIPGLAHLYIGLKERALIFFIMFAGLFAGSMGLSIILYDNDFLIIILIGYPILWLIALLDMYSAWRNIEIRQLYNNAEIPRNIPMDNKLNKRSKTLALSIIPGAGHMYLGYQKKGLIIMGAFAFSIFFMGWLGISLLLFLLPLIWFYSFFDAMHTVDGSNEGIKNQEIIFPEIKPEWIGFALIGIGVMIMLERVLYPLIDYEIRRYIQTSIVSLIFIFAGIRMLIKNKKSADVLTDAEEENIEDED